MCRCRYYVLLFAAVTQARFCAGAAELRPTPVSADEVGPRFVIYGDAHSRDFVPSGWMPDGRGLAQDLRCSDNPHSGKYFVRTKCRLADCEENWAGIAWLLDGAWFPRRKFNLYQKLSAKRGDPIVLRFWARSKPGASIEFSVGGGRGDSVRTQRFVDAIGEEANPRWPLVRLSSQWQRYQVDLSDVDLSHVVQIFASTASLFGALDLEKLDDEMERALDALDDERAAELEKEWQRRAEQIHNNLVLEWDMDEIYVVRVRVRPPRVKRPDSWELEMPLDEEGVFRGALREFPTFRQTAPSCPQWDTRSGRPKPLPFRLLRLEPIDDLQFNPPSAPHDPHRRGPIRLHRPGAMCHRCRRHKADRR